MRSIVILAAALACFKVWTQDRLYRSIMQEALLSAYRERATVTCLKELARAGKPVSANWPATASAEIVIGNASADVAIWDMDNPLWDVRFRHPHVKLTASDARTSCAFDVAAGLATVKAN